jgi:hypothetical protein
MSKKNLSQSITDAWKTAVKTGQQLDENKQKREQKVSKVFDSARTDVIQHVLENDHGFYRPDVDPFFSQVDGGMLQRKRLMEQEGTDTGTDDAAAKAEEEKKKREEEARKKKEADEAAAAQKAGDTAQQDKEGTTIPPKPEAEPKPAAEPKPDLRQSDQETGEIIDPKKFKTGIAALDNAGKPEPGAGAAGVGTEKPEEPKEYESLADARAAGVSTQDYLKGRIAARTKKDVEAGDRDAEGNYTAQGFNKKTDRDVAVQDRLTKQKERAIQKLENKLAAETDPRQQKRLKRQIAAQKNALIDIAGKKEDIEGRRGRYGELKKDGGTPDFAAMGDAIADELTDDRAKVRLTDPEFNRADNLFSDEENQAMQDARDKIGTTVKDKDGNDVEINSLTDLAKTGDPEDKKIVDMVQQSTERAYGNKEDFQNADLLKMIRDSGVLSPEEEKLMGEMLTRKGQKRDFEPGQGLSIAQLQGALEKMDPQFKSGEKSFKDVYKDLTGRAPAGFITKGMGRIDGVDYNAPGEESIETNKPQTPADRPAEAAYNEYLTSKGIDPENQAAVREYIRNNPNDEEFKRLEAAEADEYAGDEVDPSRYAQAEPIGDSGATTAKPPASVAPQPAKPPPTLARPDGDEDDDDVPDNIQRPLAASYNPMAKYGINLFETRKRFK